MQPVLLIPVFRGRELFRDCLQSIVGKESNFDQIVISINGDLLERNADKEILFSSILAKENLVVFETGEPLSAPSHSRFILRQLRLMGLDSETQIMNLFHDDWLLTAPDPDLADSETVVVGSWEKTDEPSPVSAVDGSSQSVKDWLWSFGRRQVFINGSGMISTLQVREDASKILAFFRTGVRYEHLLITHRSVKTVKSSSPATVRIRIHAGQDGSSQTSSQALRGDLAFVLWLIAQGRLFSWKELLFFLGALGSSLSSFASRAGRGASGSQTERD